MPSRLNTWIPWRPLSRTYTSPVGPTATSSGSSNCPARPPRRPDLVDDLARRVEDEHDFLIGIKYVGLARTVDGQRSHFLQSADPVTADERTLRREDCDGTTFVGHMDLVVPLPSQGPWTPEGSLSGSWQGEGAIPDEFRLGHELGLGGSGKRSTPQCQQKKTQAV